jgi:hypothetical protein
MIGMHAVEGIIDRQVPPFAAARIADEPYQRSQVSLAL